MSESTTPTTINYPSKAGVKWNIITEKAISANDVLNYLTNDVLGFNVKASMLTWHGPARGCYVVTKLAIPAAEIAVTTAPTNFMDKVLDAYGVNVKFKKDILDLLEPFRFPEVEALDLAMRDPVKGKSLTYLGISGKTFEELKLYRDLRYSPETGYFIVYLDTEKILRQMCEDPKKNAVDGNFKVTKVFGEKDEQIRWEVRVVRDGSNDATTGGLFDVSIDRIIATAR